jgi:hypothetical protein
MSASSIAALTALRGTIERRILLNYRVDPAVAAGLLPNGFRPLCHNGYAIAGVCLIRLARVRPKWLPVRVGLRSENAAIRIAAEWDTPAGPRTGVLVLARYTASRLAALAGGRIFPGVHRRARIDSCEHDRELAVSVTRGGFEIRVRGDCTNDWLADSVFASPRPRRRSSRPEAWAILGIRGDGNSNVWSFACRIGMPNRLR